MTTKNTQDADFLDLDIDTVSNLDEATSAYGSVDPIRWKPSVSKRNPSYSAIIRLLPQGIEGVKNKTYPSVKVLYHHLKLNGVHMEVKCCRNNGGDCPICRAIWDRYNELAKTYEKGSPQLKVWSSMSARPEWHTNILVREDDNKAANNGKVLVWRHSDAVERTLRAPFDDSVEADVQNANGAPAKGALAKLKKERRKFIPHSPTKGVDFGVIVSWDAAKNMTSYDGSDYVAESSPLADTKEEMLEILNSCHDLTKYLADIPDETTAASKWREFLEKAHSAKANEGEGGYTANASFSAAPNPNYAPRNTTKVSAAEFLDADAELVSAPAKEPDADEMLVSGESAAPAQTSSAFAQAKPSPFAARRAAAQAAPADAMSNQLPEGDDDDTELPF